MCKENYQVMEQQLFRINRLINHIQENAYNNEIYNNNLDEDVFLLTLLLSQIIFCQ